MRTRNIIGAVAAAVLAVGLSACSTTAQDAPAKSGSESSSSSSAPSAKPSTPAAMKQGTFAGLNDKHVAGTVTIKGDTLELAGFASDEGPDLHVYLTNGTDEAAVAAGKSISAIAFDKATQTFKLDGVDAAAYTDVVIHCDKAQAVFGAAQLS